MVLRDQIRPGMRLRVLRQVGGVPRGMVGRVDTIREERWGTPWGFSLYWQDGRVKNRYSLYFVETDLAIFEMIVEAPEPTASQHVPETSVHQLPLPFTEWSLYRGSDVVDSYEAW